MLERILEYFSKDGNLVKTIIGACVFLLCLILGKTVSKLVLTAFSRLFYKDDEYKQNMLVNSLIKPISAMIKTLGLFVLFCLVYTNDSIFISKGFFQTSWKLCSTRIVRKWRCM